MTTAHMSRSPDLVLEDRHFRILQKVIADETGILVKEEKRCLLQARLAARLRHLGLTSMEDFVDRVVSGGQRCDRNTLISAVTTNVTSFFRENHHFKLLSERILPPRLAGLKDNGRIRIWSAACSTGEEAYSIAATIHQLCPDAGNRDIRVLATDIDPEVLQVAHRGAYAADRIAALQPLQRAALFGETGGGEIRSELRQLLRFRLLNLNGDWPMRGPFDVIFCRNAAIYFPRDLQERLWQRLAALLQPGGWLILGHSERLIGETAHAFACEDITAYRKLE